ncbi:MAG: CinA family protein [Candidatus Omnitrophica bacterium]|nr:CinA family protein [Candidatus Omnitrophota bacterium]
MNLEKKIARLLIRQQKTLAIAESCTGGLLSHRLTNISGSSQFFKLGVIAYSNEFKSKILKITPQTLRQHGAVSVEVVQGMAQAIRRVAKTDLGIAITGIAGPTGGTKNKPVGMVYLAVATSRRVIGLKCLLKGSRLEIKKQATTCALKVLEQLLQK